MANRRIEKKKAKRMEGSLAKHAGASESLYASRRIVVTVPCPRCGRGLLDRTYIPAFGTMSGTVSCPRCEYEDLYLNALGQAMSSIDPLPEHFASARTMNDIQRQRELARPGDGGREERPSHAVLGKAVLVKLAGMWSSLRRLSSAPPAASHPRHRFAA